MEMHNAGKSIREIRSTIEANYRPHFGTMTPTAPAPADENAKAKGKR
jgi:hypothetical protein